MAGNILCRNLCGEAKLLKPLAGLLETLDDFLV